MRAFRAASMHWARATSSATRRSTATPASSPMPTSGSTGAGCRTCYDRDRFYTAGGLLEVGGSMGSQPHGIGEWMAQGGNVTATSSRRRSGERWGIERAPGIAKKGRATQAGI